MKVDLVLSGRPLALTVRSLTRGHAVEVQDPAWQGEIERVGDRLYRVRWSGSAGTAGDRSAWVALDPDGTVHVHLDGETFTFGRGRPNGRRKPQMGGDASQRLAEIRPPMPGKVVELKVALGDKVEPDQVVAIVEAMKMEVDLVSPIAGTITRIGAAQGDLIDTAQPLVVVEAKPETDRE